MNQYEHTTPEETVALLCGGHVYGRCHTNQSGYAGKYTKENIMTMLGVHKFLINISSNYQRFLNLS